MKRTLAIVAAAGVAAVATADIRITEWMYDGTGGEFVEFTNIGTSPIDLTGWSFDDDSRVAGTVSLSGFGVVAPGESVILTEFSADAFRTNWSLAASVKVIGNNTTNLGRNDEINIFDASNTLVDRLSYGDSTFAPGSIRTQGTSGNAFLADLGTNNVYAWFFSAPGDLFGSSFSNAGTFGNPGFYYIPAPGALALAGLATLAAGRRRR